MSDVTINYEKLVADYVQSLTTVLRGFQSGSGEAFLETWVHDDDELKSILGVVEAAKDSGLPAISIRLGRATLDKVDVSELKQLAEREGAVEMASRDDGLVLRVLFGKTTARKSATLKPIAAQRTTERPKSVPSLTLRSSAVASGKLYAEGLRSFAKSRQYEGTVAGDSGWVAAEFVDQDITLSALVEPNQHIVKSAVYQGASSEVQYALLEGLCSFMIGKPILECSDHAVIFLEFALRDHDLPPPVAGIVTPETADPMFALPTALVRGLLADYRRKTGYRSIENQYDQPISETWRKLSQAQRAQKIQEAIEQLPVGEGVHLERLETPKRVVVGFREGLIGATKQERLMKLEEELKRALEPTLQLYVEPKVDENKIRRLKEADAI